MQCRLALVLAVALCSVTLASRAEPGGQAAATELSQTEIAERVAALSREKLPDPVRSPLEQAKLGVERAAAARKAGDRAAEQRALDIARAALALAEARGALVRERSLLAAARRRGELGVHRNQATEALLQKARERASEATAADVGQ